ncbi:MAG TPA: hypothetical protein VIF12_08085, partial [Micavibrio sp.]
MQEPDHAGVAENMGVLKICSEQGIFHRPARLAGGLVCLLAFLILAALPRYAYAFCFCCDSNCGGRFSSEANRWENLIHN